MTTEESALEYLLSRGNYIPEQVIELRKMELDALRAQQKAMSTGAKTNADRIRAMTDEQLAEVIMCPCDNQTGLCSEVGCIACCLDWLKQPEEVER